MQLPLTSSHDMEIAKHKVSAGNTATLKIEFSNNSTVKMCKVFFFYIKELSFNTELDLKKYNAEIMGCSTVIIFTLSVELAECAVEIIHMHYFPHTSNTFVMVCSID